MEHPPDCGGMMSKEEELPAGVSKLLWQHQQVFIETRELLPTRYMDHAITLKAGSDPISVRPF